MKTLAKDVYCVIRHRVAMGELSSGGRVSELALAKEFGISRAPVREAIGRLASEGLLEHVPNVGAFVRKLSREELRELHELRRWIEGEAAAKAASMAREESLQAMQCCCEKMRVACEVPPGQDERATWDNRYELFVTADLSFHLALIKASGNQCALDLLSNQHLLSRSWAQFLGDPKDFVNAAESCREHEDILFAVKSQNPELARRLVHEHIENGLRLVLLKLDTCEAAHWVNRAQGGLSAGLSESLHRLEEAHKAKS